MYISQFDIPTLHVPTVPTKDLAGARGVSSRLSP